MVRLVILVSVAPLVLRNTRSNRTMEEQKIILRYDDAHASHDVVSAEKARCPIEGVDFLCFC